MGMVSREQILVMVGEEAKPWAPPIVSCLYAHRHQERTSQQEPLEITVKSHTPSENVL